MVKLLRRFFAVGRNFAYSSHRFLFFILIFQSNSRLSNATVTVHEQELLGEVGAGNYTYYSLKGDVNNGKNGKAAAVVLLLFPISGDADLYVSRTNAKPTFENGQHDFQATSCGIDRIDVHLNAPTKVDSDDASKRTKPALTVGVYGHPSHPLNHYSLKVLLFMDDSPGTNDHFSGLRLSEDDYMSEEMQMLASGDRWREWVQQVHVSDDDFFASLSNSSTTFSTTTADSKNGEGFRELLRSVAEVLLAILSFALNILVEIMV